MTGDSWPWADVPPGPLRCYRCGGPALAGDDADDRWCPACGSTSQPLDPEHEAELRREARAPRRAPAGGGPSLRHKRPRGARLIPAATMYGFSISAGRAPPPGAHKIPVPKGSQNPHPRRFRACEA